MEFASGYSHDPERRRALMDLLRDVFGLRLDRFVAEGFWDPTYTPFSYFAGGVCVANVSFFGLALVVDGQEVAACGFQSVAVREEHRRKGLFKDLMERALAAASERADVHCLFAQETEIYAPFGFAPVEEHHFETEAPDVARSGGARRLSVDVPADLALVRDRLRGRDPVSSVLGFPDHAPAFLLNVLTFDRDRVWHLPNCDAVLVGECGDGVLDLFDLAGPRTPTLERILAEWPDEVDRVRFRFTPDKVAPAATPIPFDEDEVFLVKGDLGLPDRPRAVPLCAHF